MYKNESQYINSLRKADFDPCTLSVNGYSDEFNDTLDRYPDLIKVFFNNYEEFDKTSSIENFMSLIWASENLDKVIDNLDILKEMCESDKRIIANAALCLLDHITCEDFDIDYSFIPDLNIKSQYLKDFSLAIYKHVK